MTPNTALALDDFNERLKKLEGRLNTMADEMKRLTRMVEQLKAIAESQNRKP